jgi:hypothetical protein
MKINMAFFIHPLFKRVGRFLLASLLVAGLIPPAAVFADGNILSITPASSQMNINTTFTINVRSYADTDLAVGSANGTVNYSSSLLQVVGISVSGSGYGSPSITQGASTIGFTASRNPAPGGSTQIFAITFQAKAAGTAVVGFNSDSRINGANTTYKSGVFTITNPNPPVSSPSTTPKPTPTPSPKPVPVVVTPVTPPDTSVGVEPQPTPDPTGLIDSVLVIPTYSSSTISWKVNATNPASVLSYGTSPTQLDKQATVQKKADGTFMATITGLTPGLRYNFSIDGSGTGVANGSYSGTMITQGFPVVMKITENNVDVKTAQVKIGNHSYNVVNGKVTVGLAAGSYTGIITSETASLSINLTVQTKSVPADNTAPELQSFAYNLTSSPLEQGPGSSFSILSFVGVLVAGTVLLAVALFVFITVRRRRFESGSPSYSSSPTVIVEDGYDWHQNQNDDTNVPPATSPTTNTDPTQEIERPRHANSVYITEEEPLDMFDQAKMPLPPASINAPDETPQNPNSPHSTTL